MLELAALERGAFIHLCAVLRPWRMNDTHTCTHKNKRGFFFYLQIKGEQRVRSQGRWQMFQCLYIYYIFVKATFFLLKKKIYIFTKKVKVLYLQYTYIHNTQRSFCSVKESVSLVSISRSSVHVDFVYFACALLMVKSILAMYINYT